ncbi:hypothetical protein D3C81_2102630 [compost metagenome]
MTLIVEVGHRGHFCVDSLLKDRGLAVTDGLTVRLIADEIIRDNYGNYDIKVELDNSIHYERKTAPTMGNEMLQFTVYFDLKVDWLVS